MSGFKDSLTAKSIKERKKLISTFIDESPLGILNNENKEIFLILFEKYYTPDDGEYKYTRNDIADVAIFWNNDGRYARNKCFHLLLYQQAQLTEKEAQPIPVSRIRLAGENRNENANLMRALRDTIRPQIEEFRITHPLDPTTICPIKQVPLGENAQVDHFGKTFKQLTEEWIKKNPGVKPIQHTTDYSYVITEPYHTSWYNYHNEHATLRWLSLEGNKIAHRM